MAMQEAIPYKTWLTMPRDCKPVVGNQSSAPLMNKAGSSSSMYVDGVKEPKDGAKNMVTESAVVVFGRRGCCMVHVVRRLLQVLGVNPVVSEIDEEVEKEVIEELESIGGAGDRAEKKGLQFPAVFIGGRLFGGLDRIMAAHISGELTPVLKQAGALWL
ncbi:PREDICTED: glutaredoxin-C9-like [Ipomoea nil]|uniref:glutaredoxin-C9-like n=1 Tax=Ipomoea nil TaxID=35883 RepID=UPI000900DCD6|nr:PREDICTED: glutaredoxin-C9-like [Ipomoea nil]